MDIKKLFGIVGAILVLLTIVRYRNTTEPTPEIHIEQPPVEVLECVVEPEEVPEPPEIIIYRVTAYCPCEVCCGEWAKDRPLDENGEPIVVGSWGVELVDGYSCASPMAFGTQVELEGIGTVEVQDRTAKRIVERYGENIIDIYMTDHDAAWDFGIKYIEGVIK